MAKSKGLFSWYFNTNILIRILIALVLGVIAGFIISSKPDSVDKILKILDPFGAILIRLLKMSVVPIILFSLIVGAASINPSKLGKVGVKVFVYYMITTIFAVFIGLVFANIFNPGFGMKLGSSATEIKTSVPPKIIDILLNIIPTNPFESFVKGDVLAVIFFALIFGIALSILKESAEARIKKVATLVFEFCDGAVEVMYKIVRGVMQYAPIGVFALIAIVFAKQGTKAFGPLVNTTGTTYLALAVHVVLTYGGVLILFKLNPIKFFGKVKEAMITAFITRTSNGTLPVSMKNADENLGVPRSIYSFTLPLGATINMDGTAIYLGVCAFFIANAIGMPLTLAQQGMIILTATLASIGTAGVPGAGAIMLIMVLESIGLKLDNPNVALDYAMILGIDAILDMGRTCLNVTGDLVGTTIVAKTEKELDIKKWK